MTAPATSSSSSMRVSYDLDLTGIDLTTPPPTRSKSNTERKSKMKTSEPKAIEPFPKESRARRGGKKADIEKEDTNRVVETFERRKRSREAVKQVDPVPVFENTPTKRQRRKSATEEPSFIGNSTSKKQKVRKDSQQKQPLPSATDKTPKGSNTKGKQTSEVTPSAENISSNTKNTEVTSYLPILLSATGAAGFAAFRSQLEANKSEREGRQDKGAKTRSSVIGTRAVSAPKKKAFPRRGISNPTTKGARPVVENGRNIKASPSKKKIFGAKKQSGSASVATVALTSKPSSADVAINPITFGGVAVLALAAVVTLSAPPSKPPTSPASRENTPVIIEKAAKEKVKFEANANDKSLVISEKQKSVSKSTPELTKEENNPLDLQNDQTPVLESETQNTATSPATSPASSIATSEKVTMASFAPKLTAPVVTGGVLAVFAYGQAIQEYNDIQKKKEDDEGIDASVGDGKDVVAAKDTDTDTIVANRTIEADTADEDEEPIDDQQEEEGESDEQVG